MSAPRFSIDVALRDANLLGACLGDASSWYTWFTCLRAAFGQKLTAAVPTRCASSGLLLVVALANLELVQRSRSILPRSLNTNWRGVR